jgi:hypothetical protein
MSRLFTSRRRLWLAGMVLTVALGALVLAACYPGDINSVTELDIVVTQFDSTHVWITSSTFFMRDTVLHLEDTLDPGNNIPLSRAFDTLIIDETRAGLVGYGYVETQDSTAASYIVAVSASAFRVTTVNVWYPWYPCCYGGWGWYYPPVASVSSYESGTLNIDQFDIQNADSTNQIVPVPWLARMNGVLGTSASTTQMRLRDGIRQAYTQSPYLTVKP